jgi:hypothetical protein
VTGSVLTVIPGYQRMSAAQRAAMLALSERDELTGRTVWVRELAGGAWRVTDRHTTFVIYRDGEHDRISTSTGE